MIQAIRKNVAWRAIPIAGVVGGTVFLLFLFALTLFARGMTPGLVLRYAASLVVGETALTSTDPMVFVVGALTHYGLSIFLTLIIAIVVHRWGLLVGLIGGAVLGLSLYGINFYTMTLFFEWAYALSSLDMAIAHVLFGAAAGTVYEMLDRYDEPIGE